MKLQTFQLSPGYCRTYFDIAQYTASLKKKKTSKKDFC